MAAFGLFEAHGIEIEYMIVSKNDLSVLPISDKVLERAAGRLVSDFEDGPITWSNELVLHVLEFKTSAPAPSLAGLEREFQRSLAKAQKVLNGFNALLLPTAMHPLMKPAREMRLWPHDNAEIYSAYNSAFGCEGHGWSNLQSIHLNLPFANEDEFVRLHSAIRLVLPLLPAIAASSPLVEGHPTAALDNRLLHYQKNQRRIPSITGLVIPEPVRSFAEYRSKILEPMYRDIAPFDPDEVLRDDWLNSRGAIARFGRQTIEIRVIDSQECPLADLAIASAASAVVKALCMEELSPLTDQLALASAELKSIFDRCVNDGGSALITNEEYLKGLGLSAKRALTADEVWQRLLSSLPVRASLVPEYRAVISRIIRDGNLSLRILRSLNHSLDELSILTTYRRLAACIATNTLFEPYRGTPASPDPGVGP